MTGPVLGTPVIPVNSPHHIPRFYIANLVVQWADQFVVQCGQNLILQETLFGGYRAHISFHSWLWNFSGRTAQVNDLWETFYIEPPGGGAPITPGSYALQWTFGGSDHLPDILINFAGWTSMTTTNPLPPAAPGYWQSPWQTTWPNCHTERHP